MHSNFLKTALVLGLLSAIGPFAIDMYLPALPSIGKSLGASVGAVQASLMAFFIALGLGQIIYGPVSDMVGRKAPLYFGLVVCAVGSVGLFGDTTARPMVTGIASCALLTWILARWTLGSGTVAAARIHTNPRDTSPARPPAEARQRGTQSKGKP